MQKPVFRARFAPGLALLKAKVVRLKAFWGWSPYVFITMKQIAFTRDDFICTVKEARSRASIAGVAPIFVREINIAFFL